MLTPRQVLRRLRDIVRGRRLDADVDDEVRFHIEMQTASLVAQGMSPGRARAKAESDFGAVARVTDHVRQARGLTTSAFIDDVVPRHSVCGAIARAHAGVQRRRGGDARTRHRCDDGDVQRRERRAAARPAVSARRASRLGLRARHLPRGNSYTSSVSAPNFHDWRAQANSVDLMAAFRGGESTVLGLAEPIRANVYSVSHDYFRLFGGTPVTGRTFADDESAVGGEPVAVVGNKFWRERLGGRADVSSVRLQIWDRSYRIIGIMPDGFGYPDDAELWIPLEPQNASMGRDSHNDETVARLAPGVSIAQAEAELQGIAERLKQVYPTHNGAVGAHVASLRDTLVGPVKSYLRLLLLAVVGGAARRVCQPGERQSRSRRRSRPRAGDSHRARRRAWTLGATAAHRESSRRPVRWCNRSVARALARSRVARAESSPNAAGEHDRHRWRRAALRDAAHADHRRDDRIAAGTSSWTRRSPRRHDRRRTRNRGWSQQRPSRARRDRGGVRRVAARGGGSRRAKLPHAAE